MRPSLSSLKRDFDRDPAAGDVLHAINGGAFGVAVFSRRISLICRIIPNIGVEVEIVFVSDGIGLQESAETGGVHAGAVVVQVGFRVETLTGIGGYIHRQQTNDL